MFHTNLSGMLNAEYTVYFCIYMYICCICESFKPLVNIF